MKRLWFKSEFVAPILSGEKCDTIRVSSSRLPRENDLVALAVGPRPHFAVARVERVEEIGVTDIPEDRRAQLASMVDAGKQLVRLTFRCTE